MSENIAIKLQGVSKSFSGLDIISSVDMKVREQEFISILGPSGCGKTTILKLIAGLEDVDEGSIYINNNLASKLEKDSSKRIILGLGAKVLPTATRCCSPPDSL